MNSTGELEYKNKFKILPIFSRKANLLQENLYKTAFNLEYAHEYLYLIQWLDEQEGTKQSEVEGTLFIMAVICFSTTLRKITDDQSKCNLRKLVNLAYSGKTAEEKTETIANIYTKYKDFIDKFIVHQDRGLMTRTPGVPDYKENLADLKILTKLYEDIAKKICKQYMPVPVRADRIVKELETIVGKV